MLLCRVRHRLNASCPLVRSVQLEGLLSVALFPTLCLFGFLSFCAASSDSSRARSLAWTLSSLFDPSAHTHTHTHRRDWCEQRRRSK